MKKLLITIIICLPSIGFAEGMRLSHIDSSTLLADQKVKLYVGMTDIEGLPVENLRSEDFEIYESTDGKKYERRNKVYGFNRLINYENGIQFLLMIDNSGSMYSELNNKANLKKVDAAKEAIKKFVREMSNPKDKVMLVSYNTFYQEHSGMISDKNLLLAFLDEIEKPEGDDRYTEIYGSMTNAINSVKPMEGRKVIIILSDGENCPLYSYTGKEHPEFGDTVYTYEEPLALCHEEGITVFAIHYGNQKRDQNLSRIALESGGAVFYAGDGDDLSSVYANIIKQLVHEYQIVYRATMKPAEKRYVKVVFKGKEQPVTTVRYYFASTVFGLPLDKLFPVLALPFLLGLILLYVLWHRKREMIDSPVISVLDAGGAKVSVKNVKLTSGKTVIGSSLEADMTLSGTSASVEASHATVLYDRTTKGYTLISESDVFVNNTAVRKRELESGDVIRVGDSTLVFDACI